VVLTPLAFATHRLGRRRQTLVIGPAAAGVLAALAATLPTVHAVDGAGFAWPYGLALLAALLIPFVAAARRFTAFVRRFFEETTTWGLLAGAALAALAVIVAALGDLFDLPLDRYGLDAAIVLLAGFVLVYLHRLLQPDPASPGRMPELWRRLATMIGAPFVSIMLAILIAYELTALVRGELPRNMLSPLIMAAGFVGFVTTLVISSVLREEVGTGALAPADPHRWARRGSIRLTRAFPAVLLVLLPMAGWALSLRLDEHGVTPFRAVRAAGLLCLAGLSVVGTLRWLRGRPSLTWEVPAAVVVAALASAFGPTSAVELSIASQAQRLGRRLDAVGAGRGVSSEPVRIEVEGAQYWQLHQALADLVQLGGEPALRRVLSGDVSRCIGRWHADACLEGLGIHQRSAIVAAALRRRISADVALGSFAVADRQPVFVDVRREPGQVAPSFGLADGGGTADATQGALELTADAVVLHVGGAVVGRGSLARLVASSRDGVLSATLVPLLGPEARPVASLAVEHIDVSEPEPAGPEVVRLVGVVFWPPSPAR
jgi:hypothetical protein